MADLQLVFNNQFFRKVLTYDARRIVEDRTRAIATGAAAAAGRVQGGQVPFYTDFGVVQSGQRYRGAVISTSTNAARQEAGRKALVARLRASS